MCRFSFHYLFPDFIWDGRIIKTEYDWTVVRDFKWNLNKNSQNWPISLKVLIKNVWMSDKSWEPAKLDTLGMLNNFCFHVYAQKSLSQSHTLSLSLDMLNNWKHFTAIALKISFCTKNVQWSMLTWNPEVRVTFWLPTKLGPSREVRIIGLAFICVPCHTVLSWEPEDFSIIIMSESTK